MMAAGRGGGPKKLKKTDDYEKALKGFDEKYGKGTIFRLGDVAESVEIISTGSLYMDLASGVDGLPLGRVVEIFGKEMSAKSTMAFHCAKECQKKYGPGSAAVVDVENAIDLRYVRNIGVDVDNLIVSQPDFAEQALDIMIDMIDSGHFKLVILDSVAALVPKETMSKEFSDSQSQASLARIMSKSLSKIQNRAAKMGVLVIYVNQIRDKVGVMFGKKSHSSGGNALRFYSSVRIETYIKHSIKEGGKAVASDIGVKFVKNKVAPPFTEAIVRVVYGEGLDEWHEMVDAMVMLKLIKRSGNTYSFKKLSVKGIDNFVKTFKNKYESKYDEMRDKVYGVLKGKQ